MTEPVCARVRNATYPDWVEDVQKCIAEHKLPGPGCVGCPDYPKEWENGEPTPGIESWGAI